jgi:gliding motility-associated-like protein
MKQKVLLLVAGLCSGAVLFAQSGATPINGSNPVAAPSTLSVNDPNSPQDGSTVLGPTFQMSKCGLNYTSATQKLGQRFSPVGVAQPATFTIAGIPATAVIEKAFVWCDASGNGVAINLTVTNPFAVSSGFPMTLIGSDQDKCWGYSGTHSYRADITSLVMGDGNYTISGFPTSASTAGTNDVDGATMVVIWSDPTATFQGDIVIWDGCVVINGGTTTQTMTGFTACSGTVNNARAFMCVGDLQGLGSQLTLNGVFPITCTEDWWNDIDVATTVTPGQTTSSFGNQSGGDCYNFCVMGLYWQSNCQTCCANPFTLNMTSVPSSCSASNGSASATPVGGTGPFSYSWNTAPVQNTQTASGLPPGDYIVTVIDSAGCQHVDTVTVAGVGSMPITTAQFDVICNGASTGSATVTPTGGTAPYTYVWTPNVSATGTATNLAAGTYVVDITDNYGCQNSYTFNITEPPLVPILATGNGTSSICIGASATIDVSASGGAPPYSYLWLNNGSTNDTITVSPTTTTTYTVVVSDACNTAPDSATVTITVNPLPTLTISSNLTEGCSPLCIDFIGTSAPASVNCLWNFGDDTLTIPGCNTSHCYYTPGQYSVTLTVQDVNGCINTLVNPNYITVHPDPVAGFNLLSPNPATLIEATIAFDDISTGGTITYWNFGDNTSATVPGCFDIGHSYGDTGAYHVVQIVENQWGCRDTAETDVYIIPNTTLYVPNTFTPNGDGKNDVFFVYGEYVSDFHLMVFDRWGMLIFESYDMTKGWNGHANNGNAIAQIDTYVWVVTYSEQYDGYKHKLIGHVNLVR